MRIISYNILDGGEGRADPLAEIIEAQRPDIVALVEADTIAVLDRISGRLNMDYARAEGTSSHAVAVMSRWPIVESINHALLRPGLPCLLEALVRQPDGPDWRVGVVHCRPYAQEEHEIEREQQVAAMLDIFAPYRQRGTPHLLMGDFNANAPVQKIDPDRLKPSSREAWDKNGGQIPRRAVQRIFDAGYLDSLQVVYPKAAEVQGSFSTQYPGQRVDYIFTFGIDRTRLRDGWIEQDRLARYASDHFPVGAQIA